MVTMADVPPFTDEGLLPPADVELTLEELQTSALVRGPASCSSSWDREWRERLVENLSVMVRQLWQVGVTQIFIDGSFVEEKDHPNDIDGYFECDLKEFASGRLERALNLLDPYKVWTWNPSSRRQYPGQVKLQLPMWHVYRVELYPHYGQFSGVLDRFGYELEFPSAFRQSRRDGRPRGIVKIVQGTES